MGCKWDWGFTRTLVYLKHCEVFIMQKYYKHILTAFSRPPARESCLKFFYWMAPMGTVQWSFMLGLMKKYLLINAQDKSWLSIIQPTWSLIAKNRYFSTTVGRLVWRESGENVNLSLKDAFASLLSIWRTCSLVQRWGNKYRGGISYLGGMLSGAKLERDVPVNNALLS